MLVFHAFYLSSVYPKFYLSFSPIFLNLLTQKTTKDNKTTVAAELASEEVLSS